MGAISHCEGLAAAVVAYASSFHALGLDVERATPLPAETRSVILLSGERSTDAVREKVVFSAKETVYKTVFPLVGAWIDFHEISISLDDAAGRFDAVYQGPEESLKPLVARLSGRFLKSERYIVTAGYLPVL